MTRKRNWDRYPGRLFEMEKKMLDEVLKRIKEASNASNSTGNDNVTRDRLNRHSFAFEALLRYIESLEKRIEVLEKQ